MVEHGRKRGRGRCSRFCQGGLRCAHNKAHQQCACQQAAASGFQGRLARMEGLKMRQLLGAEPGQQGCLQVVAPVGKHVACEQGQRCVKEHNMLFSGLGCMHPSVAVPLPLWRRMIGRLAVAPGLFPGDVLSGSCGCKGFAGIFIVHVGLICFVFPVVAAL